MKIPYKKGITMEEWEENYRFWESKAKENKKKVNRRNIRRILVGLVLVVFGYLVYCYTNSVISFLWRN